MSVRMPTVFAGHGSPMNAIEDNRWSRGFKTLGAALPTARAILCVSAHWYGPGLFVTANARPGTIHDFSGFPEALEQVQYPAPGDAALAQRVAALTGARPSTDWGLDHGTWSVLVHTHPAASLPVLQLSIDSRLPPAAHLELGRQLAPLRDEGVLILGSGNIVHNLRDAFQRMHLGNTETPDWAARFDADIAHALERGDQAALADLPATADGRMAVPTAEHYLPLLYVAGAAGAEAAQFPVTGFDLGSLSMRCVRYG